MLSSECYGTSLVMSSVANSHRSASPRPTTLEEDQQLFVDFSSILCLWFEIQGMRTYNFFDWVSNTVKSTLDQVMVWCRQAASHYLSQCRPRSLLPYDMTSLGRSEFRINLIATFFHCAGIWWEVVARTSLVPRQWQAFCRTHPALLLPLTDWG